MGFRGSRNPLSDGVSVRINNVSLYYYYFYLCPFMAAIMGETSISYDSNVVSPKVDRCVFRECPQCGVCFTLFSLLILIIVS